MTAMLLIPGWLIDRFFFYEIFGCACGCLCGMYSSDDSMIQPGVRCTAVGKAGVYRKLMHFQRSRSTFACMSTVDFMERLNT